MRFGGSSANCLGRFVRRPRSGLGPSEEKARCGQSCAGPGMSNGANGAAAAPRTGALGLLLAARELGAVVCFANPGTTEMQLVSALDDMTDPEHRIRPILCLHETVATAAADGYARMTRTVPALALLHLGPGLANGLSMLHNARRARSPILVLVGDMASWHLSADPVLNMDILALARSVSASVVRFRPADDQQAQRVDDGRPGQQAGRGPPAQPPPPPPRFAMDVVAGVAGSRVATLILPHDASWGPTACLPAAAAVGAAAAALDLAGAQQAGPAVADHPGTREFVKDCAAALQLERRAGRSVALYLGGAALASGEALEWAGRIGAATGAALLCEGAFARIERGRGLPVLRRLPYFPQEAQQELSKYSMLITVDAKLPVANFGYKDGPSHLTTHLHESHIWELDDSMGPAGQQWCLEALKLLAQQLGATPDVIRPGINCRGVFCTSGPSHAAPSGKLTAQALCAVLALVQPEHAIVVDESLTSGGSYWELSKGCPQFSHLTLTGGAIGIGPALSVGAAVACPNRLVINLQADGSAMYSLQALWTQARERLNVITIICDNSSYSILKVECARQRLPPAGAATRALTSLGQPALDWVSLARGLGVPAVRVTTAEQLSETLVKAIRQCTSGVAAAGTQPSGVEEHCGGPLLIQACLP